MPRKYQNIVAFLFILTLLIIVSVVVINTAIDVQAMWNPSSSVPQIVLGDIDHRLQPSYANPNTDSISDWPQVQNNPQRTGFYPAVIGSTFTVAWTHPFQPEKIFPQVQAIIYAGKVFVGTEMGNMYAFNAQTGAQIWKYTVGAPILNSVAAGNVVLGDDRIYFGAMNGSIYSLDVNTGTLQWKANLSPWRGFSTAPVLAEGKVMIGGRDGHFYALDQSNGEVIWKYPDSNSIAPILQTAAYDNGKVFFGAMDMFVYAIDTANGSLVWKSEKIDGMAFKDYWPVIYQGYVIVIPMLKNTSFESSGFGGIGFPFVIMWGDSGPEWDWVLQNGPTIAQGQLTSLPEAMQAQDTAIANYQANPGNYSKNLFILNEQTGNEDFIVPHWAAQTMHGATTPPCIDRDGKLIVSVFFIHSGWARLDLSTERVMDILYDNKNNHGDPMSAGDIPAGMGNQDESLNVTCGQNMILSMHTEEYNANYTGAFDQDNRIWIPIIPGQTSRALSTNTQGGGGNPASIADGMIYHISYDELIVRTTQP